MRLALPPLEEPLISEGGGPRVTSALSLRSRASQSKDEDDFDVVRRAINPIKLKAVAMKMRHKVNGKEFIRESDGEHRHIAVSSGTAQCPRFRWQSVCRSSTRSIIQIVGTDNVEGLKTIFLHPFSILLLSSPFGIASGYLDWGESPTFWLNFLALVPLAKILGDATEELAASIHNDTVTGLLNATFGNAVEMIVAVQSIRSNLFGIVKASLLGSVLSNTLLVLGTAFLLGGFTRSAKKRGRFHVYNIPSEDFNKGGHWEKEQTFARKSALISGAMLLFSCMSFALPTVFNAYPSNDSKAVLKVSRVGAIIVLSSYIMYLIFQLLTHEETLAKEERGVEEGLGGGNDDDGDEDEDSAPGLSATCATLLMLLCTVTVALNSEYLVDAIDSVVRSEGIPEAFIGVILLPIAGNACEHASAIRFAMQDRPGLAIGIAVGSATQISLLVVPFSVVVAWALDKPLDLDFGMLNTAVVTFTILVMISLLQDGRSNWFKGYLLCAMYCFIGVLYWFVSPQISSR